MARLFTAIASLWLLTALPAGAVLDQQSGPSADFGSGGSCFVHADARPSQTFTAGITGILTRVNVGLSFVGSPGSGLMQVVDVLDQSVLGTGTYDTLGLLPGGDSEDSRFKAVTFGNVNMVAGRQYRLAMSAPDATYPDSYFSWSIAASDVYASGGASCSLEARDLAFQTFVEPEGGHTACAGDCNGDRAVRVSELISCVRIALGSSAAASCVNCDRDGNGQVSVGELIAAVGSSLCDCLEGCTPTQNGFQISLDRASAAPFETVGVHIGGYDAAAAYTIVLDVGVAQQVTIPVPRGAGAQVTFSAPLGRIATAGFSPGTVQVSVLRNGTSSNSVPLTIRDLPVWTGAPGEPTRALLLASRLLMTQSQAGLQAITSAAPAIDTRSVLQAIAGLDGALAQMESMTHGTVVVLGEIPSGGNAIFDLTSLQLTDRIAYAYIQSLPGPSPVARAGTQGRAAGAELDFDVVQLAKNVAADFRDHLDRSSAATGTALMLGAGLAFVAGAPAVAASAATLGAVSFMVHLGVGTAISTILDAGPTAMLNGRADFEDFRESLQFVGNSVINQLLNSAAGKIGEDLFGPLGGIIGSGVRDTLTTLETFAERIEDAYDSGELPDGDPSPTPRRSATATPTRTFTRTPSRTSTRTPTGRISTPTPTATVVQASCDEAQVAGADEADTRTFNLGRRSGSFYFQYNTYSQQDRVTVRYEGQTLFDTGCVGAADTVDISYSGNSTSVVVSVSPNCAGGVGTQWDYTLGCPGSARPTPTPEPFSQMRWGFIDGCSDRQDTLLRLFDTTNNLLWPPNGQAYVIPNNGSEITLPITCRTGALICFGAEPQSRPGLSWGAGLDNNRGCTGCCATCDDVTIRTQNLVCN